MYQVIPIALTRDDWQNARDYQNRILDRGIERRENYTNLSAVDRYAKGWVGETAFARLLHSFNVRYEHNKRDDGQSDRADFVVWYFGSPITIDVKIGWSERYRPKMLIPEAQFQRRKSDLYVGGVGDAARIAFYGLAWRSDVEAWPVQGPPFPIKTRHCFLDRLCPAESLLRTFDGARYDYD